MITKKELKANSANAQFIRYHGVTEKDIEVVNEMHDLIVSSRDKTRPVPGDVIICCSDRIRYENGHLERDISEEYSSICTRPYTPFVFADGAAPYFSTSGGYWLSETNPEKYVPKGQRIKVFCTWGHNGACGSGAVHFKARVNVWELNREDIY